MIAGPKRWIARALVAASLIAAAPAGWACTATGVASPCPGARDFGFPTRMAPLGRADIEARIGTPGPPIVDEVTRDVSRAWTAVRRHPQPPALLDPVRPGGPATR
jgi:hypothetical protein